MKEQTRLNHFLDKKQQSIDTPSMDYPLRWTINNIKYDVMFSRGCICIVYNNEIKDFVDEHEIPSEIVALANDTETPIALYPTDLVREMFGKN